MLTEYYKNAGKEEQDFLDAYDPNKYEKPSVTADIVIFTVSPDGDLSIVLVKRKDYPYKGYWALPGGFLMTGKESVGECADRELKEETGLSGLFLEQLKTYSEPGRDPRMHVISVAHYALVPYDKIKLIAGDDAEDADLFQVLNYNFVGDPYPYQFYSKKQNMAFYKDKLAFDHAQIIVDAVKRIYGRKDYCLDLFELLQDKSCFTIYDFKQIYEAVSFCKQDNANFRKMFINRYVKTGIVETLNKKSTTGKPAMLYSFKGFRTDTK